MGRTVKILVSIASSEGWCYAAGEVIELDEKTALNWIAAGVAAAVENKAETTMAAPIENTMKAQARKGR